MKPIGIITFHAAYNFGSTLQAYATQQIVKSFNRECKIINYRMVEQKTYYSKLGDRSSIKSLIKSIIQIPIYQKRKNREYKYEEFISRFLELTEEIAEPTQAISMMQEYPIMISGSDQIWNKHANELHRSAWIYMDPYLLKGYMGRKVSYASSIGNMIESSEISHVVDSVRDFSFLSTREEQTGKMLEEKLQRTVQTVLDPTLLFNKEEWIDMLSIRTTNDDAYILFYSLCGVKEIGRILKELTRISKQYNLKVVVVAPLVGYIRKTKYIEPRPEFATIDFVNCICNASMVITDSYHGTLFSIIFEKDFYSICGKNKSDFRKTDILNRIGLNDRICNSIDEVGTKKVIDYLVIRQRVKKLRQYSVQYLKQAINE